MAENDSALELREVTKSFGDVVAVDSISIQVAQGEFLCIVGPSGCGKTTTLRMMAGFEYPTSGTILVRDVDVVGMPPYKRNVVMVFQNYALFPHLNVFENIAFGLRERRVDSDVIANKVAQYLDMVQLAGFEERMPGQLSGGQQQRIALARALVVEPALLLMDEPLGSLDRKLRDEMQLEIKSLLEELGITTVYVTHDQDEALAMSDRVAVMHRGRIEQVGAPREIYECPRTSFCASFLGISNLFAGVIDKAGPEDYVLITDGGRRIHCSAPDHAEGRATLIIRPERVILDPPAPAANCFPGRISNLKYLGADIEYHIVLPSGEKIIARKQTSGDQVAVHRIGEDVEVWLPVASLRLVED